MIVSAAQVVMTTSAGICTYDNCSICQQDSPPSSEFAKRVYHVAAKIPVGQVVTYGAVAAAMGNRGAARAVGSALRQNILNSDKFSPRVPCHRVVRGDGCMGGFNSGGCERKAKILREEGVPIQGGKVAAAALAKGNHMLFGL